MDVELTELNGCQRQLTVRVEPERVAAVRETVLNRLQQQVTIAGFRPGKAPKEIVASRFQEKITEEVKEHLVAETFEEALRLKDIQPIGGTQLTHLEQGADGLKYTIVFDVMPRVELDRYDGLSLKTTEVRVTDAEVTQTLNQVLDHHPHLYVQARDLQVREKMKESVRRQMEAQAAALAAAQEDEHIIDQLLSRAKLEVPESLVQERLIALVRAEVEKMADFSRKSTEEQQAIVADLIKQFKPRAEKEVKASFVLQEIAEREKIVVSDEDLEKRIELLAQVAGKEKEAFAASLSAERKEDLRLQMRLERTLDTLKRRALLIEKPKIVTA